MTVSNLVTRPRQVPWLGQGVSGSWTSSEAALFDTCLDYDVEQVNCWDDQGNKVPGVLVNRNADTKEILGVTSNQYGVVQNLDAFALLDPFCKAGGVIEHAGMTEMGMVFMVMRLDGYDMGLTKDDNFTLYVCAMNSFNGKFPLAIIITPIRVYCQNMFRKLMKKHGDTVLTIKHGRLASNRIMSASKASSILLDYQENFNQQLLADASQYRCTLDVEAFVEKMLPLVPVTPEHPRAKLSNERIEYQRDEFIRSYYNAPDNADYIGTRLGILNAYYDWVTHHEPLRTTNTYESARFGNLVNGTAINNKLIASA